MTVPEQRVKNTPEMKARRIPQKLVLVGTIFFLVRRGVLELTLLSPEEG